MLKCPECGAVLDFESDELEEGDVISCFDCDASFEVVSTSPVELALADNGREDLENDEDSEDDEDSLELDDDEFAN